MESPDSSKLRKQRSPSSDKPISPGLFTMDALLNKKSTGTPSSNRSRTASAGDNSTPSAEKPSAADKFKSIGRRVSIATTSIDRFAKSTKDKLNKKLGKQEDRQEADLSSGAHSAGPRVVDEPPPPPVPGAEGSISSSNGSGSDHAGACPEALSPAMGCRSASADNTDPTVGTAKTNKKSPIKIEQSFKVFGEKISHAAKSTGRKMSQLGNEIEHGVSKFGHQLHMKDNSSEKADGSTDTSSPVSKDAQVGLVKGGLTGATTASPEKPRRFSQDGEQPFPRMQRRVSDVLEIDKTYSDSDADIYICDPGAEEYVSKISNIEHMFEDHAVSGAHLSEPASNKSIGSAFKKMTEKVLHHNDSGEIDNSQIPPSIPPSLSGHQDLDNWV